MENKNKSSKNGFSTVFLTPKELPYSPAYKTHRDFFVGN
jgi:hypothetical protein